MMTWWNERTPREQALIVAGLAVACVMIVLQFVARPLWAYRTNAARTHAAAVAALAEVEAAAQEIRALRGPGESAAPAPLRTIVSMTATEQGVPISRLQPVDNVGLDVYLEEVSAPALFTWVATMQDRHGVSVVRAAIQRNDRATVRAQLTVAGAGGP